MHKAVVARSRESIGVADLFKQGEDKICQRTFSMLSFVSGPLDVDDISREIPSKKSAAALTWING